MKHNTSFDTLKKQKVLGTRNRIIFLFLFSAGTEGKKNHWTESVCFKLNKQMITTENTPYLYVFFQIRWQHLYKKK